MPMGFKSQKRSVFSSLTRKHPENWIHWAFKVVSRWEDLSWPHLTSVSSGIWVQVWLKGSCRQWGPEMIQAGGIAHQGCQKGLLIIGPSGLWPEGLGFFERHPRLWSRTLWISSSDDQRSWKILQWAFHYPAFDWIWIWRQSPTWQASQGRILSYLLRRFRGQIWEWASHFSHLTPSPLVHVSLGIEPHPHQIYVFKWKQPTNLTTLNLLNTQSKIRLLNHVTSHTCGSPQLVEV